MESRKTAAEPEASPPIPPEKPLPTDCCGSGCPACVLDIYDRELAEYQRRLADWEARQKPQE